MYKTLKVYIKMAKTIIKFGDIEIEKRKFHQHKRPISINNIDINKPYVLIQVSSICIQWIPLFINDVYEP